MTDTPIKQLLGEMRRRRIFRTAALYIVGTWLVMQVADVVFPAMDVEERAIRYVLFAALLGFPAAMVFGWFYDIGVDGIQRTAPAGPAEHGAVQSLRLSDYVILTALAGVVIAILFNTVGYVVDAPQQARERTRDGPPMVAVLPFVSKALAGESEFFAVGVHDDLLTQLAQLQSIRVISRTSVLEFKDTIRNIREIGRELGADAILEGGVQSAGNRIRINAQLIDAHTDEHLWAQTYDRELSAANIFDVQTEIARAITSAMRAALTEQDAAQLEVIPTENMAAYRAYHRAMAIRDNDRSSMWRDPEYREALQEAVALDPTFTRAWAELVGNLSFMNYFYVQDPAFTVQAEEALEKIRLLAPNSADHLMAKAYFTYYALKDYDRAFQFISEAQDLVPSDTRLLELKSWIQRRQGDFTGRLETVRSGKRLDPRDSQWTNSVINTLAIMHRYDEAKAELGKTEVYDYWTSYWNRTLELREHGDWDRWIGDMYALVPEFERHFRPWQLWEMHVTARDYAAAELLLPEVRGREEFDSPGLSAREAGSIMTYWFQGRKDELQKFLDEARIRLSGDANESGDFATYDVNMDAALVEAADGNPDEAARYARRWFASPDLDWTNRSVSRIYICQTLGMAGATKAAVECIRQGLVEPSAVIPFVEPFLPYYDPIRNEPEFVKLLADIGAGMYSAE